MFPCSLEPSPDLISICIFSGKYYPEHGTDSVAGRLRRGQQGYGRLLDCHKAFREAADAMSYASSTKSRIHFISDEEPYRAGELERVKILEKGFIQLFRSGTQQELIGYLEQEKVQSGRVASSRIQIQGLSAELYSQVGRMLTAVSGEEKARQAKELTRCAGRS